MKLTLKRYYDFDSIPEDGNVYFHSTFWDFLRTDDQNPASDFFLPEDRKAWIEKCVNDKILNLRARAIVKLLKPDYRCIYSYGVGCAHLEYLIKTLNPAFCIKCFDFSSHTIERLRKVFTEADEITLFDMKKDRWEKKESTCLSLLYRVNSEFSDREWISIFERMGRAGIQNILFIPGQILTAGKIIRQIAKCVFYRLQQRKMTLAGYIRTQDRFISLFDGFYRIRSIEKIGDLQGFWLIARN